jgi:hypothetical protein
MGMRSPRSRRSTARSPPSASRPAGPCPEAAVGRHHRSLWHHRCVTSTGLEHLARTAYEAHRRAHSTPLPPWEDVTEQEQQAWRAAVSAIAVQVGGTPPLRPNPTRPLVIQRETSVTASVPPSPGPPGQHPHHRRVRFQPPRPFQVAHNLQHFIEDLSQPAPDQLRRFRAPASEEGRQDQDRTYRYDYRIGMSGIRPVPQPPLGQ